MSSISREPGSTSQRVDVWLTDTAGAAKTGVAYTGVTGYYHRPGAAAASITMATQTTSGAYSSGGWVEVSSSNCPGLYQFDIPNACIASGADFCSIIFTGTGIQPCPLLIDLKNDARLSNRTDHGGSTFALVGEHIALTATGSNVAALSLQGNGTASGLIATGGATGNGASFLGGSTSGHGVLSQAQTSGSGHRFIGGSSSGDAMLLSTTSGHGILSQPGGSGKHGMFLNGGTTSGNAIMTATTARSGAVPEFGISAQGVAQAITSTTLQMAAGEIFGDNTMAGTTIWVRGTATATYWQEVYASTNVNSTDTVTFASSLPVTPSGTVEYIIWGTAPVAGSVATVNANITQWAGTAVPTPDTAGYPKVTLKSGTGAGELSLSSGAITTMSTASNLATLQTTATGIKAKTDFLPSANAGAAGGVFVAGTNAATSVTGGLTANITGNVTGNVTGNLSGSVGSVTGLTTSDLAAIKAKTDNLNFTVVGQLDANVQSINDAGITGNGQPGTEFGA